MEPGGYNSWFFHRDVQEPSNEYRKRLIEPSSIMYRVLRVNTTKFKVIMLLIILPSVA
ncbi:hypothetical protein AB1L05_20975 [Cytobacillus horneckiae]